MSLCLTYLPSRMYAGYTQEGIHAEVSTALKCAAKCRAERRQCLGIPATALLQMGSSLEMQFRVGGNPFSTFLGECMRPDPLSLCRGILDSLRMVIKKETRRVT